MNRPALLDYPEALAATLRQRFDWGAESVPLAEAGGRVLAADVFADRPQPPFDRVTMDGVAIDYAAYARGRRVFPMARIQAAGTAPRPLTDPETCIEIMTGAALPAGATTVVPYEVLTRTEQGGRVSFEVPAGISDHRSIHRTGSDLPAGAKVIGAGRRLYGAELAALATCGYAEVPVRRLPRTAIVSTGDELVDVSERPLPHQIRGSNAVQLEYLFATAGIAAKCHHLDDEPGELRAGLAALLADNELVVLSGGVSRGRFDHVPGTLAELGVGPLFHRVAQRPGKPLWVGRTERTMVFGLPGNPVSTLACALAYVGPWLRANLGLSPGHEAYCRLAEDLAPPGGLTLFQLVHRGFDADARAVATPVTNAGSGDEASVLRASGFLVLPRNAAAFREGEVYPFIPLNQLLS